MLSDKSDDIIEIIIRDNSLRKVDTWKFNAADKELGSGVLSHIQKKYGFAQMAKDELSDELERVKGMRKDFLD